MVDRKGKGSRRKSRDKLSRNIRERGKIRIRDVLKEYKIGDKVAIIINPAFHEGMPHHKFHGLSGEILNKRGDCYEVLVKDKNKKKIVIAHPVHLKPLKVS